MRSSRMRSIKSPSGEVGYGSINSSYLDHDDTKDHLYSINSINMYTDTCSQIIPLVINSKLIKYLMPWSNVKFTKNSNTQFTLTYTVNNRFSASSYNFFISDPLPSSTTISDIKPVIKPDYNGYCFYNYNNDFVRARLITSGNSIGGFNDNELQLPCRFIVFLKFIYGYNNYIKGYFYLDVVDGNDGNQDVTLSFI